MAGASSPAFFTWAFDGNLESPTFKPSFEQSGVRRVFDSTGKWTGEWMRDAGGNTMPLPVLPEWLTDTD